MSNGFCMTKAYGLEGFGEIKPKRDEKWDTHIHFDECIFIFDGGVAHCFGWVTQTNAYKLKDKETQKEAELPGAFYWKLDSSDGDCSKRMVEELGKLDASSCYKGFMKPTETLPVDSEQKWSLFKDDMFKMETAPNEKLKREDCKAPQGKRGGGGYSSKSKDALAQERLKGLQLLINEGNDATFDELMLIAATSASAEGMDKIRYFEMLAAMIA